MSDNKKTDNTKTDKQRLKTLYLYKILSEQTDIDHYITMPQIIKALENERIYAGRKAIYDDIKAINDNFATVHTPEPGKGDGYILDDRIFELSEVKLLADAVASAHFITEEKSKDIINKLKGLVSVHEAKSIKRNVYVENRVKSENKSTMVHVDTIHRAINEHTRIAFDYYVYNVKKERVKRGGRQECTPYVLAWFEDRYYLVAQVKNHQFTHFRVDRMRNIEILEKKGTPIPEGFNLPEYLKSTFSMFSGTEESVTLRFDNSLVNAVIDRFGKDVILFPEDENHFNVHTKVKTEHPEPFFGWIFQFGTKAQIISPESLSKKYNEMLRDVLADNMEKKK